MVPLLIIVGPVALIGIAFAIFPPLGIALGIIAMLIAFGMKSGAE